MMKVECLICHTTEHIDWDSIENLIGIDFYICSNCGGVNIIE